MAFPFGIHAQCHAQQHPLVAVAGRDAVFGVEAVQDRQDDRLRPDHRGGVGDRVGEVPVFDREDQQVGGLGVLNLVDVDHRRHQRLSVHRQTRTEPLGALPASHQLDFEPRPGEVGGVHATHRACSDYRDPLNGASHGFTLLACPPPSGRLRSGMVLC